MTRVAELIPNPEDLLALEPYELASVLLKTLTSGGISSQQNLFSFEHVFHFQNAPGKDYPAPYRDRINIALVGAWVWLQYEGLLLPFPGRDSGSLFVTDRAKELLKGENFEAYKLASLFPRNQLHPSLASSTRASFVQGHYDTVVFEAYRAVEVAVRTAAQLPDSLVGMALMRKAFAPNTGSLADPLADPGEQDATNALFAGAIGLFKNPASHRANSITDAHDTVALVMFASYLLRLVDGRVALLAFRSSSHTTP